MDVAALGGDIVLTVNLILTLGVTLIGLTLTITLVLTLNVTLIRGHSLPNLTLT